jgi:hypothetical protein
MKPRTLATAAFATAALFVSGQFAQAGESEDQAALIKALPGATVSLQQGLQAAEAQGRPISAKFEMEDGKLQLSVYTDKAGKFAEVIVDHRSGRVAKVEAITQGEDLAAARTQAGALGQVKEPLRNAVDKAEQKFVGYRAISALPELGDPGAVVKVTLVQGTDVKTVPVDIK